MSLNCHLNNDLLCLCAIGAINDGNLKASLNFKKQMKNTSTLSKFETTLNVLLGVFYIKNLNISSATLCFCNCNFDFDFGLTT